MSQNFMLELPVLSGAKICGTECVYRQSDGSIEALKSGLVSCVGCGRPCHMQCHKVTGELLENVRALPKNNRCSAYFGEANNVRIVCDNCLTWLNCEVPVDSRSSFLLVFSRMAAKLIAEQYAAGIKGQETSVARKRRLTNGGETINVDMVTELKDLMEKCLNKMGDLEKSNETGIKSMSTHLDSVAGRIDSTIRKESAVVVDCVKDKCGKLAEKMTSSDGKMDIIVNKIDEKMGLDLTVIDGGQTSNGLSSPLLISTPNRRLNGEQLGRTPGSTIRRRAMINNARSMLFSGNNETPRSALVRNNGPALPTTSGTAINDNIFGPTVLRFNRNRNGENGDNTLRTASQFKHKHAIYLRYVSSSVTADNMKEILKRDARIAQRMEQNDSNVEITRLVKKNVTEEMLSRRKYGISYRVGCCEDLYPVINDPGFWAAHWEIRPWNDERQVDGMGSSGEAKNHPSVDHNHLPNIPQSTETEAI